jgi:hypothetical protein
MNWFFASGDAPFFFAEQLKSFSVFPPLWYGYLGFGASTLPSFWIVYPILLVTFILNHLGLSWFWIDKLYWISVFVIAILGSYKLSRGFGTGKMFSCISSIIYSSNTYILLLFDGGQLGVALAYAVFPWVLQKVFTYFTNKKCSFRLTIETGLLVSFLFIDLRFVYIFCILTAILFILLFLKKKLVIPKQSFFLFFIVLGMNMYWILPTIVYRNSVSSFASSYVGEPTNISFFSVADFTHSLSLLHPNYPENLFGRVYFFKPEFLIIPILSFSILLWKDIPLAAIFLVIIGLVGAFLGKGVKEPFGGMYDFFYNKLPGFFLFRDPTKWYVLTAVSYAVLIPLSLEQLVKKYKQIPKYTVIIGFVIVWLFLLRLVFLGKVTGNFKPWVLTEDYIALKNLLVNDTVPGRTLWLPIAERFGFASEVHPELSAIDVMEESSPSGILRVLGKPDIVTRFKQVGISYIVVPVDIGKRIFLDDYVYTDVLRKRLIAALDANASLQKLSGFRDLSVYKVENPKSFFSSNDLPIQSRSLSDSWILSLPKQEGPITIKTLLAYDPNWVVETGNQFIKPVRDENGFMIFITSGVRASEATLTYVPSRAAKTAEGISIFVFYCSLGSLIVLFLRNRKR